MSATVQPQQFSVFVDDSGPEPVVTPHGELDMATVPQFQRGIAEVLERGATSVVLDLGALTFIDSTGLRDLLSLARRAPHEGFRIELLPGTPPVMRLFELTSTFDVLPFRRA